jgi:hypothetical protein
MSTIGETHASTNGRVPEVSGERIDLGGRSLQECWPAPEASLSEHRRYLKEGIAIMNERMIHEDNRWAIAYAVQVAGRGQDSSVSALGNPGTGKSATGDMLHGRKMRVEIRAKDNPASLFGGRNPINPDQWIPGRLVGLTKENPVLYANEMPHMKDTGPTHPLYDSELIEYNGVWIPIRDIAIYINGNFPDGNRNHPYDEAFRSRQGIEILTGDLNDENTDRVQQEGNSRARLYPTAYPLVPDAAVRSSISQRVEKSFPIGDNTGKYIGALIRTLNSWDLTDPIDGNDVRIGKKMTSVAPAYIWWRGRETDTHVKPEHLAEVAALVLPTIVKLSYIGKERLENAADGRHPNPFESAVAVRRVVARAAMKTLYEADVDEEFEHMADAEKAGKTIENSAKYAYASSDASALRFDIDQALFETKEGNTKTLTESKRRGNKTWFRKTS